MSAIPLFHRRHGFKSDRNGAIEGLPLYLIIIIVITVIGLGIILGMMNTIKPPKTLDKVVPSKETIEVKDDNKDGTYEAKNQALTVKVVDNNGDPIKGAVVTLTGCNVSNAGKTAYGTTDSNGEVKFTALNCQVIGTDTAHIQITAEKSGMGKKTVTITVIPTT
jgi:protocatechuate 3,4-dioxygenase beta subunit